MTLLQGLRLLGVASLTTLTACGTTAATGTDTACLAFQPITYSASQDTPETVRQVREHNAAYDAVCPLPQ